MRFAVLESNERLRQQVERAPMTLAFETQMERGGDTIERADQRLVLWVDVNRRILEGLRGGEVIAAIEYFAGLEVLSLTTSPRFIAI